MTDLFFQERGNGAPLILLHGFPLHQGMWDSFAEKLSDKFKVFTIDLPGFGRSAGLKPPFSIAQVADHVLAWVKDKNLGKSVLIGHSMGGYVSLAMAEKAPKLFNGMVLFHSTAYADSAEKRESRNKVLEFIDKNGVSAFTSNFIGPLFTDQKHPAIAKVRSISMEADAEAVKAYTQAMRDRPDRLEVLTTFPKPILFLAGEKDAGISVQSIQEQAARSPRIERYILSNVAHMGMFENEKKSLEIIRSFLEKITVTKS
jgi:pimeloyl-ACP methyl ester carboxylesterase